MALFKEDNSPQWTIWFFAGATLLPGMIPSALTFALDANAASRLGIGQIPIPEWVFILVWLIAYPCMGVATWLIWKQRDKVNVSIPIAIFIAGYLNTFSFWLTNSMQMTAVLDAIVLSLAYTVAYVYYQYDKRTLWWLLPWLLWMPFTFAVKVWAVFGGI